MERWIQRAIRRPGSLRRWVAQHARELARKLKVRPLTRDGRISAALLRKLRTERGREVVREISKSRARLIMKKVVLAATLRRLARRRRRA